MNNTPKYIFESELPAYFTFEIQIRVGNSWVTVTLNNQLKYFCSRDAEDALEKFKASAKDPHHALHKEAKNCRIVKFETAHTMSYYA
jgi:hypothetical protein